MSISPPSDIVLGVANAVDPEKYRVAAERLARLGANDAAGGTTSPASATSTPWATEQFTVPKAPVTPLPAVVGSAAAFAAPAASANTSTTALPEREVKAYKQLETYLMQTFIDSMLPKDASNVYGSGTAGSVWRSMLAEHIATEVASSSPLGIAEHIAKSKVRVKASADSGGGGQTKPLWNSAPLAPVTSSTTEPFALKTGTRANQDATAVQASTAGFLDRRGS